MAHFSHIAGDVALDLVNTVEWRLSDDLREDDLGSHDDVVAWCLESGLLSADEADAVRGVTRDGELEHRQVLVLREALYEALFQHDPAGNQTITRELHEALAAADYVPGEQGWVWCDRQLGPATARHRIARAIMALLERDDLERLHQCEDVHCGWVFIDTSRAHNRRWCVTKDCGDRNRSRAYYARQKNSP